MKENVDHLQYRWYGNMHLFPGVSPDKATYKYPLYVKIGNAKL